MKFISKSSFLAPLSVMAMLLMLLIFDLLGITDENSASAILISVIVLQIVVFVLPMVFYARLKEIKYTKDVMLRPFAFSRLGLVARSDDNRHFPNKCPAVCKFKRGGRGGVRTVSCNQRKRRYISYRHGGLRCSGGLRGICFSRGAFGGIQKIPRFSRLPCHGYFVCGGAFGS